MKKPSVTQLLDLIAKPALISWANKQGLMGIDTSEKRKKILLNGTSLHSQIENELFEREIDKINFDKFMIGKSIIAREKKIETEWFIGKYDAMLSDEDGQVFIIDYKSGFKGKIYLEHKLQLIAYTMAEPASIAIVPIPQFHLIPIEIKNRNKYENMLIQLSKLWFIKQEIENDT